VYHAFSLLLSKLQLLREIFQPESYVSFDICADKIVMVWVEADSVALHKRPDLSTEYQNTHVALLRFSPKSGDFQCQPLSRPIVALVQTVKQDVHPSTFHFLDKLSEQIPQRFTG
jgi:hypothetical protein